MSVQPGIVWFVDLMIINNKYVWAAWFVWSVSPYAVVFVMFSVPCLLLIKLGVHIILFPFFHFIYVNINMLTTAIIP